MVYRSTTTRAALLGAAISAAPFAAHAAVEGPLLAMSLAVQEPRSVLRFLSVPVGQSFVREATTRAAPAAAESSLNDVIKCRTADRLAAYLPMATAVEAIPSVDSPSATPVPHKPQAGGIEPDGSGTVSTVGVYMVNDSANQTAWGDDGYHAAQDLAGAGALFTKYDHASQGIFLGAAHS